MGHDVVVLTTTKPSYMSDSLKFSFEGFKVVEVPSIYVTLANALKGSSHKDLDSGEARAGKGNLLLRLLGHFQKKYGIFWTSRMPDHVDFWIRPAVRTARDLGVFDLVVSSYGPYATHVVAYFLKRSTGVLWIADFRDPWTDSHVYPGLWPFTVFERWLERKLLGSADVITTTSQKWAERFSGKYGDKVRVIENGFDEDDLISLPEEMIFEDDGKIRLVYTGGIYEGKQDPSPLFEAVKSLREEDPSLPGRLELVFAGGHMGNLAELVAGHDLEDIVKICGPVSRDDALRMQRDADALIFLDWNDLSERGVITGKLYEYIFSGTPILSIGGGPESAAWGLLKEVGRGQCFGNRVDLIKAALADLLKRRPLNVETAREAMNRYTKKSLALKMLKLTEDIRQ